MERSPLGASSSVLHVGIGIIEEVVAGTQIGEDSEDGMQVDEPEGTLTEVPGPVDVEQVLKVHGESEVLIVRL